MRKWARLTRAYIYEDKQIFKVMIYDAGNEGTYVFLYDSPEAQMCAADEWYESVVAADAAWDKYVEVGQWNIIDDPMPGCQADCILPIRVKGRAAGKPEWGAYERFADGIWVEYKE